MMREMLRVSTQGRGCYEISDQLRAFVARGDVKVGVCHCFIHHTSASLLIMENADPSVLRDLERFLADVAPDGDPRYEHDAEGPDDMPAHVRSALTATSLTIPVVDGRIDLGTWQGVFVYEHRHRGHQRRVTLTLAG